MYSEDDINSAVSAGAISAEAAAALRAHAARDHEMPRGDEENFRLVTSFNDIFVTIGVVIMLVAVTAIGINLVEGREPQGIFAAAMIPLIPAALAVGTAWGLAEIFTRRRRMALPSIVLLIAFVLSSLVGIASIVAIPFGLIFGPSDFQRDALESWKPDETTAAIVVATMMILTGALTAAATWLHWRRFLVPITVAAGTAAMIGTAIGAIQLVRTINHDPSPTTGLLALVFVGGMAAFAFAMRWDMSDRARTTRRSDVAFWLHLLAAPLIAHPIFALVGVTDGVPTGVGGAIAVLAIYALFALVALAIDRRALLVSALAYVLIALTFLFDRFGAVELNFALTALVIGSALLTLSAFWTPIRRLIVIQLPAGLQARLPEAAAVPA